MSMPDEDEFTELVEADIPRVDLVQGAANGTRFLIAKREGGAGLLDADFVRDLIGKSEPEPEAGETVTMTGSPAAMAKMIHQAALRHGEMERQLERAGGAEPTTVFHEVMADVAYQQVVKAKYNADDLKRMAGNGQAMPNESYPIADREDLDRAIRAVGRGGADHDAIRRHVIARAKALGASGEIPDNWNSDGSLKEGSVSKMELDDSADGMDPTVALAAPEQEAPGDPMDPGSPAWEAVDAATAAKWTSILARAKNAIGLLADREMLEAAAGDCDDAGQAMDLDDACCAIDYAISILAPFAVAEQSEADFGVEAMEAVGKALTGFDPAQLDAIETLGAVRKAGRVLSSANEAAIRGAVESLQKVLASLPQAPVAPESGQPVAKEETVTATATEPDTAQEPVEKAEPADVDTQPEEVAKADPEKVPQVAVYDAKGKLVGIVDPTDITPISGADADDGKDDEPGAEPEPPAEAAPDPTDLAPAPAAEVGTPADDVGKNADATTPEPTPTTTDPTSGEVLKSIVTDAVTAALNAQSAAQQEVIAKQADRLDELAGAVAVLKDQVAAYGEQPAPPKVFTNGALPPAHMLRGQDRGAVSVDMAKAAELRKGLYGPDAGQQNRAAIDMQEMAIAKLQEIHQGR